MLLFAVETLAVGETALGFVIFPTTHFHFTLPTGSWMWGVVDNYITIRFSLITSKLSPIIKIIV